jgi:hypothetical protein
MIARLYERLTGRPWTTTRTMSVEFGPPPGAIYAVELSRYTDAELIKFGDEIVSRLRQENPR